LRDTENCIDLRNSESLLQGVTTGPADPAMRGARVRGPIAAWKRNSSIRALRRRGRWPMWCFCRGGRIRSYTPLPCFGTWSQ